MNLPGVARYVPPVAYLAMCTIWGTTWLAIKVSLQGLPPIAGSGFRFIVAGGFLALLAALTHRKTNVRERAPLHLIVVLALTLFGGNYVFTYFAETHLASGLVAVLFGMLPFFVFVFAHYMVHERIRAIALIGAAIAFVGVAVISLANGDLSASLPYVVATLAAAALSAYATVYLKKYAASDPFTTLPPAMTLGGIIMSVAGVLFEKIDWHAAVTPSSIGALLYLAIFGSGIAFFLNHWLLQRMASWIVGLSALVIPVIAVIVGALFGGEELGVRAILGAALVIGGVSVAVFQRQKTLAPVVPEAT
jgi:drug/metabolite transporter (DMT)-like permease